MREERRQRLPKMASESRANESERDQKTVYAKLLI